MLKVKGLKRKIILVLVIICMILPYVPDYTPVAKAASVSFHYTGTVQTYTIPTTGYYRLYVTGATGGYDVYYNNGDIHCYGGYGGYARGIKYLTARNDIIHICWW